MSGHGPPEPGGEGGDPGVDGGGPRLPALQTRRDDAGQHAGPRLGLELQTKVHTRVPNHGEGPF